MLPIATPKTPILAPAVGQQEIEAFLEQELAAGRPQPTLRALHARFRGSYGRLTRIRREFLARKNPAAAAAPMPAPLSLDLAPLLGEVGTALDDLRRELLPRLARDSDQLARIEARVSAPAARPSSAAPIALDVIEARLFDQDQTIRELAATLRTVPQDLAKNLEGQLAALLPRLATILRRRARRARRKSGRAPRRGRKWRVARLTRTRRRKSTVKLRARYRKRKKSRLIRRRLDRPRARPKSRAHARKGRPKARRRNR